MRTIRKLVTSAILSAAALCAPAWAAQQTQTSTLLQPAPLPLTLSNLAIAPPQTSNLGTFNIVVVPGSGLASNAPALAAFDRAALAWASRISDPITVTINADLSTTAPGGGTFMPSTIGSTSSISLSGGYDTVRNAMVADAAAQPSGSLANNAAVAALPTAAQFSATLPAGRSVSGNLQLTKANAKALGFSGLDTQFGTSDATIVFNSAFNFDYDNTNGVTAGSIDFQTAATHEIGHALGFTSSVDSIDTTTATQLPTVSPTTLDLFRFARTGTNHPMTITGFTNDPRDLTPGDDTVTSDLANEYRMSTGVTNGDGNQASHWKDDGLTGQYIGIMDPTLASGTTESLTDADFRAMDLIGYDIAPEPSTIGLLVIAAGVALLMRRRALPLRAIA